jgi:hypothetical protein
MQLLVYSVSKKDKIYFFMYHRLRRPDLQLIAYPAEFRVCMDSGHRKEEFNVGLFYHFYGVSSFGEIWPPCGRHAVVCTEWRMSNCTCNYVYDVHDCMILLVPLTLREERRLSVLENRV